MNKIRKEDIKQEVFDLYDAYAHNRINRRQFIDKLSLYAVGGLTVSSLLSFIMPNYLETLQLQQDDPRLKSEFIHYDSPKGGGSIKALLSRPCWRGRETAWHCGSSREYRGLNPHIEDVGPTCRLSRVYFAGTRRFNTAWRLSGQ